MWRSFRPAAVLAGASVLATAAVTTGAPAVALPVSRHGPGAVHTAPGRWGRPGQMRILRAAAPDARAGVRAVPGARLVPQPGTNSQLEGIFCQSSADCWAVGHYQAASGANLNQALHWNGSKWSQATTPDPGGTASGSSSELFSVGCRAAKDCWAVGDYMKKGADLDQALHWNGSKWSVVPTPTPGGNLSGDENRLFDVVCLTATNCWAAGQYGNNGVTLNQVLHWNGSTWSQTTTPNPGGTAASDISTLDAIRCTSASNCWTVGEAGNIGGTQFLVLNEALHWNGHKWSQATTPNPGGTTSGDFSDLSAVSCTSASNCWADGSYGSSGSTGNSLNEALHWNGATWALVSTPDPDGTGEGASNLLIGLSCTSATNCWAVGDYGSISGGVGVILNEALHWDGAIWSQANTPNPAGTADTDANILIWVHCNSQANCWAVGDTQKPAGPLLNQALHWTGTKWSTG
jgi:hypothetical protein